MPESADPALGRLRELDAALVQIVSDLQQARARVLELTAQRDAGRPWREIVAEEQPPLVVELLTTALDRLAERGSAFRRAEARALHAEGMSMEQIARVFGVTRQRISALIRER